MGARAAAATGLIGAALPSTVAASWLATAWDQNSGLQALTPVTAELERVALGWLLDVLGLPAGTAAGFVTGNPPSGCTCSSWTSGTCGVGGCNSAQRQQIRTCTPTGCNSTSQCVSDATCNVQTRRGDLNADTRVDVTDLGILLEAGRSGAEPGTVHRFDTAQLNASPRALSTHGFGVADAVMLAASLDSLPGTLLFFGIEADAASKEAGLSDAVHAALPGLVAEIESLVRSYLAGH